MTRRPARHYSLSPRSRSPSHMARRSSRGRHTSPRSRRTSPNHQCHHSTSRSPTPRPRRSKLSRSRSPRSRSTDHDRRRRLHEADQPLLHLLDFSPVPQRDEDLDSAQNSPEEDSQLSAEAVKKLFDGLLHPPKLSHYADHYPVADQANNQLVPYNKDTAEGKTVLATDDLDTHDGLFKNYKLFHRLSAEQEHDAGTSAYRELINLMLSWTSEDKQLINVTAARAKADGPFHSNLEAQPELKKKQEKLHLQWPPTQETKCVVYRTLGLYQHGQQPKAGSLSSQWPRPTVKNPWDNGFSPKDFPSSHKVPSILLKCWELHEDSPIMLKPSTSTAVDQVPDAEIAKCSALFLIVWHYQPVDQRWPKNQSPSTDPFYHFLQKVITFFRTSIAKYTVKNDTSVVDDLLQHVNSMVLEAQLMSLDAGVPATELYTHLHMLWLHTSLESPAVDLRQRDKAHLLVCRREWSLWIQCQEGLGMEEWHRKGESKTHLQGLWREGKPGEGLEEVIFYSRMSSSISVPSVLVGCTALSEVPGFLL